MTLQRRLLLPVTLLAFLAQATIAREWSDATGRFKVEAELVKVAGDKVFLRKQSDGATIQVPIARLSAPDQAYVESIQIGDATSATDMEKKIKVGLAKLPAMVKAANEAASRQGPQVGPKPINPAMLTQMLGGPNKNIAEAFDFEQAGNSLKVSAKFPPGSPPLMETITQFASMLAMMRPK